LRSGWPRSSFRLSEFQSNPFCGWSILSGTLNVPYTCCIRHENWLGYLCSIFSSPHPHVQYLGDLLTAPVDSSLLQLVCYSNCLALSSFSGEKCPPPCYCQFEGKSSIFASFLYLMSYNLKVNYLHLLSISTCTFLLLMNPTTCLLCVAHSFYSISLSD
jgi:hypothetical protein